MSLPQEVYYSRGDLHTSLTPVKGKMTRWIRRTLNAGLKYDKDNFEFVKSGATTKYGFRSKPPQVWQLSGVNHDGTFVWEDITYDVFEGRMYAMKKEHLL